MDASFSLTHTCSLAACTTFIRRARFTVLWRKRASFYVSASANWLLGAFVEELQLDSFFFFSFHHLIASLGMDE
jgi:hypothetical protein